MRTTLTLDPDVALAVKREIRSRGKSLKAVVNEGLRRGLGAGEGEEELPPFEVKARHLGLQAGIDPNRLNQLVDELEVEHFLGKHRR